MNELADSREERRRHIDITLRDNTEWVETVNAKWNALVGADLKRTHDAITKFQPPSYRPKVFGPSDASERIAKIID